MVFTFTIFPKDLLDDTEEEVKELRRDNAFSLTRETDQINIEHIQNMELDKINSRKKNRAGMVNEICSRDRKTLSR